MSTISKTETNEALRAAALRDAETKAIRLFEEIGRDIVRSGVSEKRLSDEIHQLGEKRYNVRTHWHKRVIRSGPNTLAPFVENPPDRIVQADDILVIDLGPVFEDWEADFGRTYVLGDDPNKTKIRDALEPLWMEVKRRYRERPEMTGEELYDIACQTARDAGWEFGADIAGHLVGSFPHERIPNDKIRLYIAKGNDESMANPGKDGLKRHWILEMHLRDPVNNLGAFYEQLLSVD